MREHLKTIDGLRKEFIGTFDRFGQKSSYRGPPKTTILLTDVACTISNKISGDHIWFNLTKEFSKANLHKGDIVKFQARVKEYWKGYKGNRYEDEYLNEHPIEKDYKLSHPTKVSVIKRVIQEQEISLDNWR